MKYLKLFIFSLILGSVVAHYYLFVTTTNKHYSYIVSEQKQLNVHWNAITDLFKMDFYFGNEFNALVLDHNKLEDRVIALEKIIKEKENANVDQ